MITTKITTWTIDLFNQSITFQESPELIETRGFIESRSFLVNKKIDEFTYMVPMETIGKLIPDEFNPSRFTITVFGDKETSKQELVRLFGEKYKLFKRMHELLSKEKGNVE